MTMIKIIPVGVVMNMIINMKILMMLFKAKRIIKTTRIFHIPLWRSVGTKTKKDTRQVI